MAAGHAWESHKALFPWLWVCVKDDKERKGEAWASKGEGENGKLVASVVVIIDIARYREGGSVYEGATA